MARLLQWFAVSAAIIELVSAGKILPNPVVTPWSYNLGDNSCKTGGNERCGPTQWWKAEENCNKTGTQSPIDTHWGNAEVHPNSSKMPIILKHIRAPPQPGKPSVCNGATLIVDKDGIKVSLAKKKKKKKKAECPGEPEVLVEPPKASCKPTGVSFTKPVEGGGGKLKALSYRLVEYHWKMPSEHTEDGRYFPLEMQLVLQGGTTSLTVALFMTTDPHLETGQCTKDTLEGEQRVECMRAKFFHALMMSLPPVKKKYGKYPPEFEELGAEEIPKPEDTRMVCTMPPYDARSFHVPEEVCSETTFQEYTALINEIFVGAEAKTHREIARNWMALPLMPEQPTDPCSRRPITGELDRIEMPVYDYDILTRGGFHNRDYLYRTLDPFVWFVPEFEYYFFYEGSETSPPCSPSMDWILHPKMIKIYESDLQRYHDTVVEFPRNRLGYMAQSVPWNSRSGTPNWPFNPTYTNSRPPQPLNRPDGVPVRWGPPPKEAACIRDAIGRCGPPPPAPNYSLRVFWRVNPPIQNDTILKYLDSSPTWASSDRPIKFQFRGLNETINPWNSFDSSMSESTTWSESDPSNSSTLSFGIMGLGSSGSYMALWKWMTIVLAIFLCCIFGGIVGCCRVYTVKTRPRLVVVKDPKLEPMVQ